MHHPDEHRVARILLVAWSIMYLLYTLLGAWLGSGPDALAGPSTTTDNIFAVVWVAFSIAQLAVAAKVYKRYTPKLFAAAVVFAVASVAVVFVPLLAI